MTAKKTAGKTPAKKTAKASAAKAPGYRLSLDSVLGIAAAQIDLPATGLVVVSGRNASGKTSLATALRAVAAHDANPAGVSATAQRAYLSDGADEGSVSIARDGDSAEVRWQIGRGIEAPTAGPLAQPLSAPAIAGLVDFAAKRPAKERAAMLQSLLLPAAAAVLENLRARLDGEIPAEDASGVISVIEQQGWADAESIYADRARRAKSQWEQVAGARYGVKIADDWTPDGWQAAYDRLTIAEAEAAVTAAREKVSELQQVRLFDQRIQDAGVRARELIAEAEAAAAALAEPERAAAEAAAAARQEALAARAKEADAVAAGKKLRAQESSAAALERLECPACSEALHMIAGALVRASDQDATAAGLEKALAAATETWTQANAAAKAAAAAEAEAESALRNIQEESRKARQQVNQHQAAIDMAAAQAAENAQADTPEYRQRLAAAEQDAARAAERVEMIRRRNDAADLRDTIAAYAEIAKAIGPQGVRAALMSAGLGALNRRIAEMGDGEDLKIDESGGIALNGRPMQLCSESERWRVQAMIQVALAMVRPERGRIVVLDRADVLDAANLAVVFGALARRREQALIIACGTELEQRLAAGGHLFPGADKFVDTAEFQAA